MKTVYEYLKDCGTFFLATEEGNQPRVRPFGVVSIFENRLYFQSGKKKAVYKQLTLNPRIEICAVGKDGSWIRIEATAVEDNREEARKFFLDDNPSLKSMYAADDGNCVVFYLKEATATIATFGGQPEVIKF